MVWWTVSLPAVALAAIPAGGATPVMWARSRRQRCRLERERGWPAALLELPTGGLAPVLRELSTVLGERLEAREKARSRAASIHTEAAVLAISPVAILLLIGWASPGYLSAYKGLGGTIVLLIGGAVIAGCYALMRRLGRVPEPRRTRRAGGAGS